MGLVYFTRSFLEMGVALISPLNYKAVRDKSLMTQLEKTLENKTHVIWDWNGTLLDDVDLCVRTMCTILEKYGLPTIDREAYRHRFSFPVMDYYRSLGFDFETTPFQVVGDEWMEIYQRNFHLAKLHTNVESFLLTLKKKGICQSVLSAAKETHLIAQLTQFKIYEHFTHVVGISDHYAKGKVERGFELMERFKVDKSQMVLVGDTDHDYDVGKALGIQVILLGDGHQHPSRFEGLPSKVIPDRCVIL